jgi:S-DNA-T family DNA segregation ATPase FtsK/SpoIIIE
VPKVHNLGGRAGAWLSDLLLYIFGFSAWWWALCLLRLVWKGYRRLTQKFVMSKEPDPEHAQEPLIRAIGFVLLFIGSVGLEFLRMYSLPRAPAARAGRGAGRADRSFTPRMLLRRRSRSSRRWLPWSSPSASRRNARPICSRT